MHIKRRGMRNKNIPPKRICGTLVLTEQTKAPASGNLIKNLQKVAIHVDICGPLRTLTYGKIIYSFTLTSPPDRCIESKLLTLGSEDPHHCLDSIVWIKGKSERKVERLHTENAKKFLSMKTHLQKFGIVLTTSSPHTAESNGLSETMNMTLLDKVRSVLKETNMNLGYCGEALQHGVYLHNRTVTATLKMRIPYEMLFKGRPDN